MALNFFSRKKIKAMDADDIPEEFINYFETLDENSKASLIESRPDLAKALGFVLPGTETVIEDDGLNSKPGTIDLNEETDEYGSNEINIDDDHEEEEFTDNLKKIRNNYYEGLDLDSVLKDDMPGLEALAIPDETKICILHRSPLESRQIKFRNKNGKGTYGIILKYCRACHRVYLEESKMSWIHKGLNARGIPHMFYDLELTFQYLQSQILPYEFSAKETMYIPDVWVEEDPICPIHNETLYKVQCIKKYKNRKIQFTAYRCESCEKYLMRKAKVLDLLDKCAEVGIPQIRTERLVKEIPHEKYDLPKTVMSNYIIEDGKRIKYSGDVTSRCLQLSESDIVVVSDSIYCAINGHDMVEEVLAMIRVLQKRGGVKNYLFRLGYCISCEKYYMAHEDYNVLYKIGRPAVTIFHDLDESDYYITSGEVFNLERKHLGIIEKSISDEIAIIRNSPDFVSPYATDGYDDGNLAYAKRHSRRKYGGRLNQLTGYIPKPYSYRVDISLEGKTETYYIGVSDMVLGDKKQVISANSDFGHSLINYQTTKITKDGKDYSIRLSRQFDINDARLFGYMNLRTDEDEIFKSGITDPFLVRVLNMRKRQHSLTDIFVTIQENQNRIVNTPFSKNIIVQGCAGSGKTMILLHRLSSLNYKEKNFDFEKNALILTPHNQFSLHIKGLADELQIGYIRRASVEQYYIDMLKQYSPEYKRIRKVSSEMNVQQSYVDYIYSDQFRKEFANAYSAVIEMRNSFVTTTMNELLEKMDQPLNTIDLSDDSKVIQQIKFVADNMNSIVEQRESDAERAKKEYRKHLSRKRYLRKKIQSSDSNYSNLVKESLPRVHTKIGEYVSERRNIISNLQESIKELKNEKDNIQEGIFNFGKREKLKVLNRKIKIAERKLNSEKMTYNDELLTLNKSMKEKNDDEVLSWMRKVMLIVPDVREDVKLCNNNREENLKFTEELNGIDMLIETAKRNAEEKKACCYSEEVKSEISDFCSIIDNYSMTNIFQLVFDMAVQPYKKEHEINAIKGKYYRYNLYARLLFAMKYYGKALGTTRFMCVDEGQDLAYNEYRLLYDLNQQHIVFNIFGDTNQLMKTGRGISDWSVLSNFIQAENYKLNENYRNTNQITRFCNRGFDMTVTQTGVDGLNVREIPRRELEAELANLKVTKEKIAILVPRSVQKSKYLDKAQLPSSITEIIGDKMDNGFISLMYVDEVKGIEFDKAYVVCNKMIRNEKYIAYTRALSELILVIDSEIEE